MADLLLEIGCAELPAKRLAEFSEALKELLLSELQLAGIGYEIAKAYATPRRFAVLIEGVAQKQAARTLERHGPFLKDAYNKEGIPSLACLGFARSSGVSVDELSTQMTDKGERVYVKIEQPGLDTEQCLPNLLEQALKKWSLGKTMRSGDSDIAFLRPIEWITLLFNEKALITDLLGVKTTAHSFGHRFHHPEAFPIFPTKNYAMILEKNKVIVDFAKRKALILEKIREISAPNRAIMDEALLEEVTGLVEWPVILKARFDTKFLQLPKEVLITSLKTHQKCFTIEDTNGQLQPAFIVVSNIESKDPNAVIIGNERVIHARLSDAQFFFEQDLQVSLASHYEQLNQVIFQEKLGSLLDKTKRVSQLAKQMASTLHIETALVERAAYLSKCDLLTKMVHEFPNLQGLMGYYYALHSQENPAVACALVEQYLPRFSADILPNSMLGTVLALADRLDTLVGIIGIGLIPTGDKDPFGLRRATIGIIRLILEKQLHFPLLSFIQESALLHQCPGVENTVMTFILERLKYYYLEKNISVEVWNAVLNSPYKNLVDFDQRILAVSEFQKLEACSTLAAANKRVNNLLKKQDIAQIPLQIDFSLLDNAAEKNLAEQLIHYEQCVTALCHQANYAQALQELAHLKTAVDTFFEEVMIMAEDLNIRFNRLALLKKLHDLFSQIAEVSELS